MKVYSQDFRKKILDSYDNTPICQRQLAQNFNVALFGQREQRKDILYPLSSLLYPPNR
jgi:hypothetical protein